MELRRKWDQLPAGLIYGYSSNLITRQPPNIAWLIIEPFLWRLLGRLLFD